MKYNHLVSQEYLSLTGTTKILKGEVGLLTRNVVFRGDPTSDSDENGAIISMYSSGDDASIMRISSLQMNDVG